MMARINTASILAIWQDFQASFCAGAPGLHFYTLNKSRSTVQVLKNLGLA
jgi:5,10-methylenetetrahydrofolate reductase